MRRQAVKYLLDTNICVFLLKDAYGVKGRLDEVGRERCFISDITLAELYFGAAYSGRMEEKMKEVDFIGRYFKVLPVHGALRTFGEVKAHLQREGRLIDDFDLLIGATAVVNGLVMVTDNVRHLGRIPGLRIENWVER